ncbi:MAG TPA: ATP-binding cassette domain-containing protein [Gammaproteobacteria bacterium]|nr:ATP-binding cassette domain-containing protein [Gammaproteobacteria bacterium]
MSDTLLALDAVETGYAAPVIGPLSLRIDRGEIVGLAGPNGAGKSTLLKAIADGAQIFGGRITRKPGLTIAWMEQQHVRLARMPFNGWEYLRFANADEDAPPPRLRNWLDQRVDSLSGGQFQLLSCWTALGTKAELVLLDEPTNNLDEESMSALRDLLIQGRDDRAILLVSHDRDFLEQVSGRVVDVGR